MLFANKIFSVTVCFAFSDTPLRVFWHGCITEIGMVIQMLLVKFGKRCLYLRIFSLSTYWKDVMLTHSPIFHKLSNLTIGLRLRLLVMFHFEHIF